MDKLLIIGAKMKKLNLFIFFMAALFNVHASCAQMAEGVDSFKQSKDSWRRKETVQEKPELTVVKKIQDSISKYALNNILEAEQIFCYTVDKPNKGYNGYTMDGMAITGFCGILGGKDKELFINEFFYKEASTSNIVSKCVISPKVMIRFVKGVDYTDVLLSSPCQSFSIFYAGKIKSYNAEPAAKIIDAFVNIYSERKIDFVSPALLGQLMPIGMPKTVEQKALVKEKKGDAPVRNWGETNKTVTKTETKEQPVAKKGWNRLRK